MSGSAFAVTHHAFSSGAGRTSDGNGSHASTLKSPSYTKSVSWQHYRMTATGASGSSVTVNTPTAGLIPNGATVEREIPSDFQMGDTITLNLKRPSFKDANNIAAAINASFGGIATAQSSTNLTDTD